ncbi:MAG: hypothetical protein AB1589_33555 [Cyanobacteriota bacterium]
MPVSIQTQRTRRFIDPWPYVALGATGLVFSALVAATFFQKTLLSKSIYVSEEEPIQLEPLQLKRQLIGALRIDVEATIATNQWVTYEIQVLDPQGKVIASVIKQAWSESGTWYEDGESGSWYEDDLVGGLDVRAKKQEQVTIAIAVLEYGDSSGREIDRPVPLNVTVQNGVVDKRYLWAGLVGATSLAVLACIATPMSGKEAIAKSIGDSDPSDRSTVGGSNHLVRVNVDVESDENSPRQLDVSLFINDAYGEQIYARSFPVKLSFKEEEGKVKGATGQLEAFFILEPRSSYGFHVEVLPDAPVDRTTLTVRDGSRTLQGIEVAHISPSPLADYPQDYRDTNAD